MKNRKPVALQIKTQRKQERPAITRRQNPLDFPEYLGRIRQMYAMWHKTCQKTWISWNNQRGLWIRQRPFVASLMIFCSGLLVLWGPLAFLQFALLPGSTIWSGILVGAMLCMLGIVQLFAPWYPILTGSMAIVLALISLLVATGGFGVGMILGMIGGSQSVAWRRMTLSHTKYQEIHGREKQKKSSYCLRRKIQAYFSKNHLSQE